VPEINIHEINIPSVRHLADVGEALLFSVNVNPVEISYIGKFLKLKLRVRKGWVNFLAGM